MYIFVTFFFRLKATFHDNIGNEFHAGPKKLQIRTSRCDLLKVAESDEDATIWIYTKAIGSTVIKGWAEGNYCLKKNV